MENQVWDFLLKLTKGYEEIWGSILSETTCLGAPTVNPRTLFYISGNAVDSLIL